MRVLLDTQVWLWWLGEPERLGRKVRELIGNGENALVFSVASCWEIAIKVGLGKLTLPEPVDVWVPSRLAQQGMTALPVELAHVLRVAGLPQHHRDPFDRLLVAQAQVEGLPILTADPRFADYGVDVIPAAARQRVRVGATAPP